MAAALAVVGPAAWAAARRLLRVEVHGGSMAPALLPGDRLVVVRGPRPRPGQVVAVRDPRRPDRVLVKRVAGPAPGGGLVVLGDRPQASTDSRTFGPVPPSLVLGRAVWRYFPGHRSGPPTAGGRGSGTLVGVERAKLERVLDDSYTSGVTELAMEELRSRRAECQELEVALSFQRRMAQGRLDIVAAERDQRAGGEARSGELVDQLSDILSDRIHAPGLGRLPQLLAPDADEVDTSELDRIVGPGRLAALGELTDDELAEVVERLSAFESEVSDRRHGVHRQIDILQAEITRRYRTGQASVESLLG